jgi:large subunit ribosomal protein L19
MNAIIKKIEDAQIIRKTVPFRVGDTVKVSIRIKEGEKERIQVYEGLVIGIQGAGAKLKFTVRKLSYGVGVEKSFYYQSPLIKEVKTIRSGKIRRAKLFYLRSKLSKKDSRIQESKKATKSFAGEAVAEAPVEASAPVAEVPVVEAAQSETTSEKA